MGDIMSFFETALAQATGAAQKQPSMIDALMLPIGLFVILYFFMIRPQQRKVKDHRDFLTNLKVGEEVVTGGGIIGIVRSIAEQFVTIEIASDTKIKVLKNQIQGGTKTK
jgi:preprotein translocase subunit YajC